MSKFLLLMWFPNKPEVEQKNRDTGIVLYTYSIDTRYNIHDDFIKSVFRHILFV